MALTLKELVELTQDRYQLRVLAGSEAMEHVVTWVHMMEYTSVVEFFWGNEVVVTSGYAIKNEEDMIQLIDILDKHRCTGLIINVGKYIHKIPNRIIQYCNEKELPLLIMPWRISITEIVRECCSLINQSSRDEELLAQTILHIIFTPQDVEAKRRKLDEYFQEEEGFLMLAIRAERKSTWKNIEDQRSVLRLHTALRSYEFFYLIFRYEERFLILMNQKDPKVADEMAERIVASIQSVFPKLPVQIGISDPADSYEKLIHCFHGAIAAARRASLQNQNIIRFKDMSFYKLLYSVPDDALLLDYYHEVMDPILEYDRQNKSAYTETLMYYLLNDGSLQAVALKMHTHRNTVHYRMSKIREMLGCNFATQKERLPYLIAYHIGVMLKCIADYEK